MTHSHTVAIIQCRFQSTRLPGKAMYPLVGEMTLLEFLLRRLKKLKNIDDMIVTTGQSSANDPIEQVAAKIGIKCSRGEENDVLSRFLKAAAETQADTIVRICADNPLTDPALIDELITRYHSDDTYDHLGTFAEPSVPYGVGCAIFSTQTLAQAKDFPADDPSREHIEPFMLESSDIKTHHYIDPGPRHLPALKVTVDTQRDYDYVQPIAAALYRRKGLDFTTEDLIQLVTKPRIALFANGQLGLNGAKFFKAIGADIAALVLHPADKSRCRDAIKATLNVPDIDTIDYTQINDKGIGWFEDRQADICVSLWSSYIFKESLIKQFPLGVYNLHNSLLPALGGCGANIWTLLNDMDHAGATLHRITPEIDQGPIIEQRSAPISYADTGKTVFDMQQAMMAALLKDRWPDLAIGKYAYQEPTTPASYNSAAARDKQKTIALDDTFTARELINIIRAYDFGADDAAQFTDKDGQPWDLRLSITPSDKA